MIEGGLDEGDKDSLSDDVVRGTNSNDEGKPEKYSFTFKQIEVTVNTFAGTGVVPVEVWG